MRTSSQYLTPLSPRMLDELTYAAIRGRYGAAVACPRVTRDALVERGMLTEARVATQWSNYVTVRGWAYLREQGIVTTRPADPFRTTLDEALAQAYPAPQDPDAELAQAVRDCCPAARYAPARDGFPPIWTDPQDRPRTADTDTPEDTDHDDN